jgi:hypothetical protein
LKRKGKRSAMAARRGNRIGEGSLLTHRTMFENCIMEINRLLERN